jgi:hypothetical protein
MEAFEEEIKELHQAGFAHWDIKERRTWEECLSIIYF